MTRPMWNVPFGIKLLNVQGNHAGIVVADVFPDSPAQRAGIRSVLHVHVAKSTHLNEKHDACE